MGLFRSKPHDELLDFERLVVKEFARAGRRGRVIRDPDDPFNTQLATDVGLFGFANVYLALRNSAPAARTRVAREHVLRVANMLQDPTPDLDDPASLDFLRARIVAAEVVNQVGAEYARPFAPGLTELLCLDLPQTVQTLTDQMVEGRNLDDLFARGRVNLRLETFGTSELFAGVNILEGSSLFVASQLLRPEFARDVIGPSPAGWVFAIPDRHTLAFHVIQGPDSVVPVTQLAGLIGSVDRESRPGGLVSRWIYYTDGEVVQQISRMGENGTTIIEADGPFLAAIDAAKPS